MKTLNEHNNEMFRRHNEMTNKTGILCDACKQELVDVHQGWVNMSNPPCITVQCLNKECKEYKEYHYMEV